MFGVDGRLEPEESDASATLVVIGGGCSGILTTVQLLINSERASLTRRIVLVERSSHLGAGVAYGTLNKQHLLNVPAGKMSAFPERPDHFLDWVRRREPATEQSFLPRALYARYLHSLLADTAASCRHCSLELWKGEAIAAIDLTPEPAVRVELGDGRHVRAEKVVLATGNLPPANPLVNDATFYRSSRYVRDPWAPGALDGVAGSEPVLLVGTGLTAVDVVLTLLEKGHTGTIHAISRHGLLPHAHAIQPSPPRAWSPSSDTPTTRALMVEILREMREATAQGEDWRSVVDGLRPVTQKLWQALSYDERRRFLSKLSRHWEVHRHRMPPEVGATIDTLVEAGQLIVRAAHLEAFAPAPGGVEVTLAGRMPGVSLVAHVINCTGAQSDVTAAGNPLLDFLLVTGAARSHPLGMGLDVTDSGALIGADGEPSKTLFALGVLRRGQLWESTAVPEIRQQAADLARLLIESRVEVTV